MEFEKLQEIIAEVMNVETDDIAQIVMGIEEAFDIEIPSEASEQIATVGDAVEQIKNAMN